jgi:hypothetical protein
MMSDLIRKVKTFLTSEFVSAGVPSIQGKQNSEGNSSLPHSVNNA